MNDPLLWSLTSVVVTGVILLIALASLFDLRRRIRIFREHERNLPVACRMPGLRDEVQLLESNRDHLMASAEEAKSVLYRRKAAEQWLQTNEVVYEKASRELPALKAQIELAEQERDTSFGSVGLRLEVADSNLQVAQVVVRKRVTHTAGSGFESPDFP